MRGLSIRHVGGSIKRRCRARLGAYHAGALARDPCLLESALVTHPACVIELSEAGISTGDKTIGPQESSRVAPLYDRTSDESSLFNLTGYKAGYRFRGY